MVSSTSTVLKTEYEYEYEKRRMRQSLMNSHQQSWWFTDGQLQVYQALCPFFTPEP